MSAFAGIALECVEDNLQMGGVIEEVGVADVNNEGADIVLPDIMGISFLDAKEVIIRDALFVWPVPFADIGLQLVDRCVEVDEDIGLDHLGLEDLEEFLIEPEFLFGEVDFGEQQAFGEEIVGDGDGSEEVGGIDKFFQLLVTFGHKEEFQRKGVLSGVLIEFGEERVVGELFEDEAGVEMAGEHVRQGCFAGADISFYSDEVMVHTTCFTARGSVHSASSSRIVFWNTGWIKKGAISSSGVKAKRRCLISG